MLKNENRSRINHVYLRPVASRMALFVVIATFQSGCSLLSSVGELPALHTIQSRINDINLQAAYKIPHPDIARFNSCMAPLSTRIKPAFIDLVMHTKTLKDDIDADLAAQIADLEQIDLFDDDSILSHILGHLPSAVALEQISGDPANDPRSALARRSRQLFEHFREQFKAGNDELKEDTRQALNLSKTYLSAYFKKGATQSIAGEQQNDQTTTKRLEEAGKLLKRKANDPMLVKAAGIINPQLAKVEQKASGFIGRDGTQYGFPGVAAQNTAVAIDHNQIGADSIRIILEALRDTYAPLPVLANSTAAENAEMSDYAIDFDAHGNLKMELDQNGKPKQHKYSVDPEGKTRLIWHYDHADPDQSEAIAITEKRFQTIEAHARKAEAQVAGTVGKAIRGGSWGALNNEAIAKVVETTAGVLARHAVERGGWCLLAQDGLVPNSKKP